MRAQEWIDNTRVESDVFERWPEYRVVLVAADVIDRPRLEPIAEALFAAAHESARRTDTSVVDAHVARWHGAYRDFGVKPRVARNSVDALMRRAVTDGGMPRISLLVDLYNALSVVHRVPIGGEDLDRYAGAARLVIARGDEPFHTTANGEAVVEHPEPGEPVWVDDDGVTCRRWNWRQTTRTAIRADTQRVAFIVDSLAAPAHEGAHAVAERLCELLPGALVRTIDAAIA